MTEKEIIEMIGRGGSEREAGINALFTIIFGEIGIGPSDKRDEGKSRFHKFFMKHGVKDDAAHDLAQETFIKIVASAPTYSGTGNAMAWVWQIARNNMIDYVRKNSRYVKAIRESLEPEYKESKYLSGVESALAVAKTECNKAYDKNDLIGIIESQEKIISLQNKLDRLKNSKSILDSRSDTYSDVVGLNEEGNLDSSEFDVANKCPDIEVAHVASDNPLSEIDVELNEGIEYKKYMLETCNSQQHRSIDECVAAGLELFANKFPNRAAVIDSQMDGISIEEIAAMIGRSSAATRQYLYESKIRIRPFIRHCTELLSH